MMAQADRLTSALAIDLLVESPLWRNTPAAEATVRTALAAAAEKISAAPGEVAMLLSDDAALRRLNRDWRGIDKATNVLSFPARPAGSDIPTGMLGDIAIAYETLERECRNEGKEFLHHLSHLAVHGFLHLMGYDHQTDADAEAMERMEIAILARLKVPDPYLVRES